MDTRAPWPYQSRTETSGPRTDVRPPLGRHRNTSLSPGTWVETQWTDETGRKKVPKCIEISPLLLKSESHDSPTLTESLPQPDTGLRSVYVTSQALTRRHGAWTGVRGSERTRPTTPGPPWLSVSRPGSSWTTHPSVVLPVVPSPAHPFCPRSSGGDRTRGREVRGWVEGGRTREDTRKCPVVTPSASYVVEVKEREAGRFNRRFRRRSGSPSTRRQDRSSCAPTHRIVSPPTPKT